jgi:hypothetical protein
MDQAGSSEDGPRSWRSFINWFVCEQYANTIRVLPREQMKARKCDDGVPKTSEPIDKNLLLFCHSSAEFLYWTLRIFNRWLLEQEK